MKKIITLIVAALFLGGAAFANERNNGNEAPQTVLTIKTSKASKTLVQEWANTYMQMNGSVKINVTCKQSADADLEYTNGEAGNEAAGAQVQGKTVAYVGRYAILPVTSASNPLNSELSSKNWSVSDLRKLYFASLDEDLDEDDEANSGKAGKLREKLTVYSGANASSSAAAFAKHFGFQTSEIRGNKISGDDLYLLNAIDEDRQSLTFNNVAYLYDTQTRHLKQGIAILPLKVKSEVEETLQAGNLDETLRLLEQQPQDIIPVQNFGFAYSPLNASAESFLEWVITSGQAFNNQNGFMKLATKDVEAQLKTLAQR